MKILLPDGNERSSLAAARDLGRAGHWVLAGGPGSSNLCSHSRFVRGAFSCPVPMRDSEGYVRAVKEAVLREEPDLVLPVTDVSVSLLLKVREELGTQRLPFPSNEVWETAGDKVELVRRALQLDVPVPRTIVIEKPEDLNEAGKLGFPVVVRARRSRMWIGGGWVSAPPCLAGSMEELASLAREKPTLSFPFLVQERVEGPGMGAFFLLHRGEVLARFAHRRLREKPPAGGVSTWCESVALEEPFIGGCERLLRNLNWEGLAMVEYKEDTRDGLPRLIEINGRLWGSLELAIACGVRFPSLLATLWEGKTVRGPERYPLRKVQWRFGDLDHLLLVILKGHQPSGKEASGKIGCIAAFLRGCFARDQVFRWSDPGPWFYELGTYLGNLANRGEKAP